MEYRRFVSYLYEYRQGEKKENRGFVKAEVRQNMARFLIHMYLPEKREQLYRVYGFTNETNILVLLGQENIKHGNVDIRLQMPVDAIGLQEDKVQMSELSGMFLRGTDDSLYATIWEEGELPVDLLEKSHMAENSRNSEKPEQNNNQEPVETEKTAEPVEEVKKPEALQMEPQIIKQDLNESENWEEMQLQCPRMESPAGYEEATFLRIEPRHLKYFPKKLWHLGRNSFLLHGYYNYRYFIAAKYKDGIIVGIPGIYSPREEQMASLFGFGNFRSAGQQSRYPGNFGYWLGFFKGD